MATAPIPERYQRIREYFNSMAGHWYQHTSSMRQDEFNRRTITPVLDCMQRLGRVEKGGTLNFLDAGCGVGYWTWEIFTEASEKGYLDPFHKVRLYLLDLSPEMLEEADHVLNTNERYGRLVKLLKKDRLEVKYLNSNLKDIDQVQALPAFDITFFHKVLSMFEYGATAQKTFSKLARNTTFMLTAVKARQYYFDQMASHMKRATDTDVNKSGDYFEVRIPTGATSLVLRRLMTDDQHWIVNDDARPGGKEFFEYTYDSFDLIDMYESKNGFMVVPSYQEGGVPLVAVGKPVIGLGPEASGLEPALRQDWFPLIQVIGVKYNRYSELYNV